MSTAPNRASVVLVRARLGGGKSRVLDEITSSLAASGRAVRRILATTATASVPFGAVRSCRSPAASRSAQEVRRADVDRRTARGAQVLVVGDDGFVPDHRTGDGLSCYRSVAESTMRSRSLERAYSGGTTGLSSRTTPRAADAPTSWPDRRRTIECSIARSLDRSIARLLDCSIEMLRPSLIANLRFPGELVACDVMSGTVRT